jgi:hypothetical protein
MSYAWLTFTEWGRKYGPITYCNVAGRSILVINTPEAAFDLLEKRASIYSDRPRFVMADLSGATAGSSDHGGDCLRHVYQVMPLLRGPLEEQHTQNIGSFL